MNGKEIHLLWGGDYNSTKDFMHFELRDKPQDGRDFQKAIHGIDIQEIKDYLNSFNKQDGSKYDY